MYHGKMLLAFQRIFSSQHNSLCDKIKVFISICTLLQFELLKIRGFEKLTTIQVKLCIVNCCSELGSVPMTGKDDEMQG